MASAKCLALPVKYRNNGKLAANAVANGRVVAEAHLTAVACAILSYARTPLMLAVLARRNRGMSGGVASVEAAAAGISGNNLCRAISNAVVNHGQHVIIHYVKQNTVAGIIICMININVIM